jgi:hypothetical protein
MGSVMAYVIGAASAEVAVRTSVSKAGKTVEEWAGEVFELAQAATADQPVMQESIRRRVDGDFDAMHNESFAFGLDTMLDGLQVRLKK